MNEPGNPPAERPSGAPTGDPIEVRFTLNGSPCVVAVPAETTLLKLLREHLLLTGTKCGCEIGQCGACTVILEGQAVASCLILAGQIDGLRVETVEGLSKCPAPSANELHPLQKAFLDHDAVACGFCTPGMLMSAKALLDHQRTPSRAEIRRAISGNLCRCTGYVPIVAAIESAARAQRAGRSAPEDHRQ
jgi:aerobic-type carbon monoxide dehydrogenase small subunit (CoxS/CutS family)